VQLLGELQASKKSEGKCCLFIDYKSAYNTVDREILYQIITEKQILKPEEVEFLRLLHKNLFFKVGENKYFFKNGVHQGSPISPALFDIYIEKVIEELREATTIDNLFYKLYADDVVFIVSYKEIANLIENLFRVSKKYNLQLNPKKSGILLIKDHKLIKTDNIMEIPII
jgi:hypothetical protein